MNHEIQNNSPNKLQELLRFYILLSEPDTIFILCVFLARKPACHVMDRRAGSQVCAIQLLSLLTNIATLHTILQDLSPAEYMRCAALSFGF